MILGISIALKWMSVDERDKEMKRKEKQKENGKMEMQCFVEQPSHREGSKGSEENAII